ncbi:MAG: glycoside hydrolase family 18 protein [Lachnospiraceae bacterium]
MRKHKLISYCETKHLGLITNQDILSLDSIHIAFGLLSKHKIIWDTLDASTQIKRIRNINPSISIILSVGGWAADGFSQAARTKETRAQLIDSALYWIEKEKLDGIDLDWEYPCVSDGGIESSPDDKENFTFLIRELRLELDRFNSYKTLSIAAGGLPSYLEGVTMSDIVDDLDYVQLMTYDFHGGFSKITGHLANLYPSKSEPEAASAHTTIELFVKAGVPIEKIVMGAAFYGREWRGVPSINNGLSQIAEYAGDLFRGYAQIEETLANGEEGFEKFWDESAKSTFLYNKDSFISYEDKNALLEKVNYVKQYNMYGLMYWEYSQDSSMTLTTFLSNHLT